MLIARYDANFLALSRRIEEVQREASATETRLRAGLTPRPGETPEETEARIKSLLKANDDAAYISKLSSQFGSKTPGKVCFSSYRCYGKAPFSPLYFTRRSYESL